MQDRYYTPAKGAEAITARLLGKDFVSVLDGSVGGGALLNAASQIAPSAKLYGVDIDLDAVKRMRDTFKFGSFFHGDFLAPETSWQTASSVRIMNKVDVVVLNPPFSHRGGSKVFTEVSDEYVSSGRAMAFVLRSLSFLRVGGHLLALLPETCLYGEKDASARTLLITLFKSVKFEHIIVKGFTGCRVNLVVLTCDFFRCPAAYASTDDRCRGARLRLRQR